MPSSSLVTYLEIGSFVDCRGFGFSMTNCTTHTIYYNYQINALIWPLTPTGWLPLTPAPTPTFAAWKRLLQTSIQSCHGHDHARVTRSSSSLSCQVMAKFISLLVSNWAELWTRFVSVLNPFRQISENSHFLQGSLTCTSIQLGPLASWIETHDPRSNFLTPVRQCIGKSKEQLLDPCAMMCVFFLTLHFPVIPFPKWNQLPG